jgi:hypothetical protein
VSEKALRFFLLGRASGLSLFFEVGNCNRNVIEIKPERNSPVPEMKRAGAIIKTKKLNDKARGDTKEEKPMAERQGYKLRLGGESFLIRVQYKENTSWQGTIHWLEERKSHTFRSLLELITLLQEALEKGPSPCTGFHTWEAGEEKLPPGTGGNGSREGREAEKEELA